MANSANKLREDKERGKKNKNYLTTEQIMMGGGGGGSKPA